MLMLNISKNYLGSLFVFKFYWTPAKDCCILSSQESWKNFKEYFFQKLLKYLRYEFAISQYI